MAPVGRERLAPFEIGLCQLQCCFSAVERCHRGAKIGDLVVHVLDGVFELEAIGPPLSHLTADLRLGGCQIRLGRFYGGFLDRNLHLIRFLVELDQDVSLLHAVVVIHQDLAYLACDARSNERHVAIHVSVVGRNRI